jgi:hypothetical protein
MVCAASFLSLFSQALRSLNVVPRRAVLCRAVLCAGEALKYDPDHSASRKAFNKLKDLDRKRQRAEK